MFYILRFSDWINPVYPALIIGIPLGIVVFRWDNSMIIKKK